MDSTLKTANVVVVARQFNPWIFDQIWLIDNGIASREDFRGDNFTLTPPFVQFSTPEYTLMVVPEQLQFTPRLMNEHTGILVREKVGRITELLPQTPYVALGLNFLWHIAPGDREFAQFSRSLFFCDNPLFSSFDSEDARFGGYLSKKGIGEGRLRLDVKPVRFAAEGEGSEVLQFSFNYNLDLPRGSDAVAQMLATLERWDQARTESSQVIQGILHWSQKS